MAPFRAAIYGWAADFDEARETAEEHLAYLELERTG
jgi:hypothetical protein